jgi:hypothetical protein
MTRFYTSSTGLSPVQKKNPPHPAAPPNLVDSEARALAEYQEDLQRVKAREEYKDRTGGYVGFKEQYMPETMLKFYTVDLTEPPMIEEDMVMKVSTKGRIY